MKNSPNAARRVLRESIPPLGRTIKGTAATLRVKRTMLSKLMGGKPGISPEMAVRCRVFYYNVAEARLTHQVRHELAQVRIDLNLKRLAPVAL